MSKPGGVFANSMVTCSLTILLIAVGVDLVVPTRIHGQELAQPKLIWERTFDRGILAVGVDKDCYDPGKKNIASCLKWILLRGRELRWFDENGEIKQEPLRGRLYPRCISGNSRYFCVLQLETGWSRKQKGVHYIVFDWDGKKIWEMDEMYAHPRVWNDGSVVFPRFAEKGRGYGVKFFDRRGMLTNTYEFGEERYVRGQPLSMNDSLFVMASLAPGKGYEVCVFDNKGQLLWKQDRIRSWFRDPRKRVTPWSYCGVTTSDRGEVLFLVGSWLTDTTHIHIYDRKGILRDTLSFAGRGYLVSLKTFGDFAFVSTARAIPQPSRFLRYDFERMQVKFLLEAEEGCDFWNFDVDVNAGLTAVAIHQPDSQNVIKIYDLDGNYKSEVRVEVGTRRDFWFQLLRGAILVAEKNRLRLHEIREE